MSNKNYDCSQITQNRKATCSNNNYYYTTNVNGLINPLNQNIETNDFTISGNTTNPSFCLKPGQNFQVALCDPEIILDIDSTGNIDMTGATTVTAPTVTSADSSTNVATTAFVQSVVSGGGSGSTITPVDLSTPQTAKNVTTTATTGFVVKDSTTGENLRISGNTISSDGDIEIQSIGNSVIINTPTIDAHTADLTAQSFIKDGGTSQYVLLADGTTALYYSGTSTNYYPYHCNTAVIPPTLPPPITGNINFNDASQNAATFVYINHMTDEGIDIDAFLSLINIGDILYLQSRDDSTQWIKYNVTSTLDFTNSYWKFGTTFLSGEGSGGLTSFGSDTQIILSIFTNQPVINTRLTNLETKTQNIVLASTTPGVTTFTGRIDMNVGTDRINIGTSTGLSGQQNNTVAIGNIAGSTGQQNNTVAIGNQAGQTSQNYQSVAIGYVAGQTRQGYNSVAVGHGAAFLDQRNFSVAIGTSAGATTQGSSAVAIGNTAGITNQGDFTVAIGNNSASSGQVANAIAIGNNAGATTQGAKAVAIGYFAGNVNQGANSVAIGNLAGNGTCVTNSVVLNGSGVALPGSNSAFYVAPIRAYSTQTQSGLLQYDTGTKEICYNNSPTVTGLRGSIYHTASPTLNTFCYVPFVNSNGLSGYYDPLFDSSLPLIYNPSSSILSTNSIQLSFTTNNITSFAGGFLTIEGNTTTTREFLFPISANMTGLNVSNSRNNGIYRINISNSSGSPWTISNGLTASTSQLNKTSFATTSIASGDFWIMTIKVSTFGTSQTYNCISLEKFV